MSVKAFTKASVAGLLVAAAGCEIQKSANPLSPNIAGPLPNVTITAPRPLEPPNGAEILTTSPVRLVFENASSNSPRPFWQLVEIAADASFSTVLYSSGRLDPDPSGRTTHVVAGKLADGVTYYWRARAEDGANASDPSTPAYFSVVEPVVIDPPIPVSPIGGQTASSDAPDFVVTNGRVSGPAGVVVYRFEVATDPAFAAPVATGSANRSAGPTTTHNLGKLAAGQLFYWRAWGTNGKVTSDYSAVQSFRTPTPPPAPSPGPYVPPPPSNKRTPDPPPGQRLPLPNMFFVVQEVAQQYPAALANSCQDHGGTWEFMDRVVDRLRQYDTRWGYNWKRGRVGDPSLDVVDYHWGPGPDEGSTDVYIIDIIAGHCGPNPSPTWNDVTEITYSSGTIGRWTGRGRF